MASQAKLKKSKNQLRRERLKEKKKQQPRQSEMKATVNKPDNKEQMEQRSVIPQQKEDKDDIIIDDVDTTEKDELKMKYQEYHRPSRLFESDIDRFLDDPNFQEFKKVVNRFYMPEDFSGTDAEPNGNGKTSNGASKENGDVIYSDDEAGGASDDDKEEENSKDGKGDDVPGSTTKSDKKLTKRQLRKRNKIPLAVLKSQAKRPEAVEWYDVDAPYPELLVYIKCMRNVVPVPFHWQLKKEYLSSKRGIEKPPFELPKYIKDTGIVDLRDTTQLDSQSLKQKVREKVQPKLGKMDLDYRKLHDAFFKYQEKPKLLGFGDMYYEGRDHDEVDIGVYRPGKLSENLRLALGIPVGAPPPWVINMHRFGPPPSYPDVKLLDNYGNAGGASNNNEYYYTIGEGGEQGDIISSNDPLLAPVEKKHWGELKSFEEEEEEEEEESEEEEEEEGENASEDEDVENANVRYQDSDDEKPTVVGDIESVPISAFEAPGAGTFTSVVQQRQGASSGKLYEVLEEQNVQDSRAGFMGGHTYKVPLGTRRDRDAYEKEQSPEGAAQDDLAAKRARYEKQKNSEGFKF